MNLIIFITFSKQENCVQKYREVGFVKVRFSGFDLLYIVFFCCYTSFFYAFKGNDFSQKDSSMN